MQIYLQNIHGHEETDEVGADEPYVLVTAVNLKSSVVVSGFPVPLPAFEVTRYGSTTWTPERRTTLLARRNRSGASTGGRLRLPIQTTPSLSSA
jgi:hypothetical protein